MGRLMMRVIAFIAAVLLPTLAHATASFCAVVTPTPDGTLNLRSGPSQQSKISAVLRAGDSVLVDTGECRNGACDSSGNWKFIESVERLDGRAASGSYTQGWASARYLRQVECPEEKVEANQASDDSSVRFSMLPEAVKSHVLAVRKNCQEAYADREKPSLPTDPMNGIETIRIEGRDAIAVDNERLCASRMAGFNCTNRGCDLRIWARGASGAWQLIFDEHTYRMFVSVNRDTSELQLIAMSVYAGDKRCRPTPGREYTSGNSCDLLVTRRKGQWLWMPASSLPW